MHFGLLVDEVSELSGLPRTKVAQIIQLFQSVTKEEVRRGGTVILPKFGTFYPRTLDQRSIFAGRRQVSDAPKIRFRESRRA